MEYGCFVPTFSLGPPSLMIGSVMRRQYFSLICMLYLLGSTSILLAQETRPAQNIDSASLLNAVEKMQNSTPPYYMHIASIDTEMLANQPIRDDRYDVEMYNDGTRLDIAHKEATGLNPSKFGVEARVIWNGKYYVYRRESDVSNPDSLSVISGSSGDEKSHFFFSPRNSPFLFGYFEDKPIIALLAEATTEIGIVGPEAIDGKDCIHLKGHTIRGSVELWVDVQGLFFRRAIIDQRTGDLHFDRTLPYDFFTNEKGQSSCSRIVTEFHITKEEKVGDRVVPTAGLSQETFYANGFTDVSTEVAQREVQWNPDFQKVGAFVMDKIPEGTPVQNMDAQHIPYEWRNGVPVVAVPKDAINELNNLDVPQKEDHLSPDMTSKISLDAQADHPQSLWAWVRWAEYPAIGILSFAAAIFLIRFLRHKYITVK